MADFEREIMGKINSKDKGARFERTLAGMFKDYGYHAERTAQFCGKNGGEPDVKGVRGIHIEAKHQEKMYLYDWMEQAVRDAKPGMLPTVFHKKNNAEVLVTMRFDDWMKLYREWEANHWEGASDGREKDVYKQNN